MQNLPQMITYLSFSKYGKNVDSAALKEQDEKIIKTVFDLAPNQKTDIMSFNKPSYIATEQGVGLIHVYNSEKDSYEVFIIAFPLEINANVKFFISSYSCELKAIFYSFSSVIIDEGKEVIDFNGIINKFLIEKIYSISFQERKTSYTFKGESHPFYELTYIDMGKINVTVGDKEFVLSAGEMLIIDKDCFHCSSSVEKSNSSFFCISFLTNEALPSAFVNKVFSGNSALYGKLQNIYMEYCTNKAYSQSMIFTYLQQFLIELIRNNEVMLPSKHESGNSNVNSSLYLLITDYIEENIGKDLSLEAIASEVHASPSTIRQLFVKQINKPISVYIKERRMNLAKKKLFNEDLSITEISKDLGYCSVYHFSYMFKSNFGFTPSEYRKSLKKN